MTNTRPETLRDVALRFLQVDFKDADALTLASNAQRDMRRVIERGRGNRTNMAEAREAGKAALREKSDKYRSHICAIIADLKRESPDMSAADIAARLNKRGPKPERAELWTRQNVAAILARPPRP